MAWNLIDTLNSDLKTENLFDGLPENAKKLSGQALPPEKVQEIAAAPRLDDSPEISRRARLKQDIGQAQVFNSAKPDSKIGVFDSIPTEEKTKFTAAPPVGEEERKATLGEVFNQGVGRFRDIEASFKANNYGKDREKGENSAFHAAWKAALLDKLSSHVEDNYGIPKDQVGSIFTTLAKTNGGFRTAREMDEIIKIQKEGVSFTGVDGEVTVGPDEPWEVALAAHKAKQTAALRGEKPVEDKTVAQTTAFIASIKSAYEMPEGTPEQRTLKTATISNLEDQGNAVTGGKFYRDLHQDRENTIATAVKNMSPGGSKTKTNWLGKDFKEAVDPNDSTSNMTSFEKLADMAATGQLPTATLSKDGANLRAADAYIKKFDVLSTPVGVWNAQTGTLDMFRYTPSEDADKQLVPMTSLASPDSAAKPAPTPEPVSEDDARYPTAAGKFGANAAKSISEMVGGVNDMLDNSVVTTAVGQKNIGPLLYNAGANVVEAVAGASGKPLELKRTPYYRTPTVEENKANRAKRMARLQGI